MKRTRQDEANVDSEDDSDDSSSADVDVDADTAKKLMALEHDLQTTPSYEKYLEYIVTLRAAPGLRTRLREAHEAMAARFPLTEELWLGWVNDELTAVSEPEDVERLLGLLRRAATRDYLAPAIWELYLEVAFDLDPAVRDLDPEGVDRYRGLCEEALAAAGLHLAAGHRLWDKYRKFELAVEAKLAEGAKGGVGAAKQQDRVRALYQRQLQVPLQDVAATLEEYKAWEAGHGKSVPAHVVKAADKARDAAEVRLGCEAGVAPELPADVAKLGSFMSYIKLEQNSGDPARVQVLYERAVAAFPLTHDLWLQYGQYMETHTKLPGPINNVYSRAVRNCPWVGAVWERAIRALDRTGASPEAVDEMYDNALQAGLQSADDCLAVTLARLDFLRRRAAAAAEASAAAAGSGGAAARKAAAAAFARLRAAFTSAGELMMSHFPDHVDRTLSLPAYWVHCEVYVMADVAAAREVWEGALKGSLGRFVEAWEAYIALERTARNVKEARALYKRCHNRRLEENGQLRLCHAWLRFEREEGSAEDYLQALLKVQPILEETAAAAAAAVDQAGAAAAKAAVQKVKNLTKEEMQAIRQSKDPNYKKTKKEKKEKEKKDKGGKAPKRVAPDETHAEAPQDAAAASTKRARLHEPEHGADPAAADHPLGGAEGAAAAAAAGDGDADMNDEVAGTTGADADMGDGKHQGGPGQDADKAHRPHYTDQLTVFIKGLKAGVKDAELAELLKGHVRDGIKDIRIIRNPATGQARGFAYVECRSRDALKEVVALNGTKFQNWNLFVAESKPPGAPSGGGRGPGGGRGRFGGAPPGGRGGRGRGSGGGRGWGGEGGGGDDAGDTEMADAAEGAAGAAGGHSHAGRGGGGGRGGRHPGLGHPAGRGSMRMHLQIAEDAAGKAPATSMLPRSVQLSRTSAGTGGGGGGGAAAAGNGGAGGGGAAGSGDAPGATGQQLSNDDFRKMLLGGKK